MKAKNERPSAFERMMSEMISASVGNDMLEECMKFPVDAAKKIPLRYRLIALGFVAGYTLEELDDKLAEEGCAKLYARSLWEAGLIYAFLNGMDYQQWSGLQAFCERVSREWTPLREWFSGRNLTLEELVRYVRENSDKGGSVPVTAHVTARMRREMEQIGDRQEAFEAFVLDNLQSFSRVREKGRYYFCKYLCYYLTTKIEDGIEESAFQDLYMFKGISRLKRKKMEPEEIREYLYHTGISCGGIFDAFDNFYFAYVSMDWMEVLLEYYGNIGNLPEEQKKKLASSLRNYDRSFAGKPDDEVLAEEVRRLERIEQEKDRQYSLDEGERNYQSGRSGENAVRKFIKGTLDIDRTTPLSFLIFFGSNAKLPPEYEIREKRLNHILLECGFSCLDREDAFDSFVLRYLDSDRREDCLMEEVTRYALMEENFCLYHTYQSARSHDMDFRKIIGFPD